MFLLIYFMLPIFTKVKQPVSKECAFTVAASFRATYEEYREYLGCPIDTSKVIPTIAEQNYQGGHLFWRRDNDDVYIIYDRADDKELFAGKWDRPTQKWDGTDAKGCGYVPPSKDLYAPQRGFGWLWCNFLDGPKGKLGWALEHERGIDNVGKAQPFEQGILFQGSEPKIYCLVDTGEFFAKKH